MRTERKRKTLKHPLMSWDLAGQHYWETISLGLKIHDAKALKKISDDQGWIAINWRKELRQKYDTLVLTDASQQIHWVNEGFQSMTGYTPEYAIGKSPTFLQGKGTSSQSVLKIAQAIQFGHRFKASIVNYRKNGEEYHCHLSIIPIKNKQEKISHFLALETEIK